MTSSTFCPNRKSNFGWRKDGVFGMLFYQDDLTSQKKFPELNPPKINPLHPLYPNLKIQMEITDGNLNLNFILIN